MVSSKSLRPAGKPGPDGADIQGTEHDAEGGEMTDRDAEQVCADGTPGELVEEPPHALTAVPHPLPVTGDDETAEVAASRGGCRTDRRGWAGAHLHGAVRPRRRAVGRGRPPGRWC
jgi:hypothetical protein